jgi:cyclopropane-fatty-acyl-phospholipid synthase
MSRVDAGVDRAHDVVRGLHGRLAEHGVDLPVRLWDGTELGPASPRWRLVLRHPWSLRSLLRVPFNDLAAGEAYLEDQVDIEGSMVAAMRAVGRIADLDGRHLLGLARRLRALPRVPRGAGSPRVSLHGRRHSQRRDAAAVRHHYDVGNDFYRLFLGSDLVYSCAVFAESDRRRPVGSREVLDGAQRRKLDLVCRKLRLRPGEHLLDIGCGWGALVIHAARHYGVRATGITLSPPQAELARDRIRAAGLSDRVHVEVTDYRDMTGSFDAVASVGMVEHVGADQLEGYASHLADLLVPSGRLLNHGITTGRRDVIRDFARDRDTFVARHVFPDGALVPAHQTIRAIERAGIELWDVQQLRPHYARTLEHWVANLEAAADAARALVGERIYRTWRAYMAGSAMGFETGDLGVVQVLAVRPPVRLPYGRDWMTAPG